MKLFLSPHNDDAVLFGTFTLLRDTPKVITCFDSFVQPSRGHDFASARARRFEDELAIGGVLGCHDIEFLGIPDNYSREEAIAHLAAKLTLIKPMADDLVYAPAIEEGGNEQHNLVGKAAQVLFGDKVVSYLTYTTRGKSTNGLLVPVMNGEWIGKKLFALSHYKSQFAIENCRPHFLRGLEEYYG